MAKRTNRYADICQDCGKRVAANEGLMTRDGKTLRWEVRCPACFQDQYSDIIEVTSVNERILFKPARKLGALLVDYKNATLLGSWNPRDNTTYASYIDGRAIAQALTDAGFKLAMTAAAKFNLHVEVDDSRPLAG